MPVAVLELARAGWMNGRGASAQSANSHGEPKLVLASFYAFMIIQRSSIYKDTPASYVALC